MQGLPYLAEKHPAPALEKAVAVHHGAWPLRELKTHADTACPRHGSTPPVTHPVCGVVILKPPASDICARSPDHLQFPRCPPLGPARLIQPDYRLLSVHFGLIHRPSPFLGEPWLSVNLAAYSCRWCSIPALR